MPLSKAKIAELAMQNKAIVQLIRQGKTLEWIGGLPDLPNAVTIKGRADRNPAFAAQIAQARADWRSCPERKEQKRLIQNAGSIAYQRRKNPNPRPYRPIGQEVLDEVLRRVSAGDTLSHFLGKNGYPTLQGVLKRCAADPAFAVKWEAAKLASGRIAFSRRVKAYAPAIVQEVARLLRLGQSPQAISEILGMPSGHRIRSWVRSLRFPLPAKVDHRAVPEKTWDEVLVWFGRGYTVPRIAALPGMPGNKTLLRKIWSDHAFAQIARTRFRMSGVRSRYHSIFTEPAAKLAVQKPAFVTKDKPARGIDSQAVLVDLRRCIPRYLPDEVRDDVAGDMLVDLCAGKLRAADIKAAVPKYLKKFYADQGTWKTLSLETPVGENFTLGQSLGL